MTHQILPINDYLQITEEIAKTSKLKKFVLTCTLFLAVLSLGFGIYSSNEVLQAPENQKSIGVISVYDADDLRLGKVFLAFDHEELNGVVDIEEYLNNRNQDPVVEEDSNRDDQQNEWTEEEVRNQIVIKGIYYAGH